jgi:hypothetical protein
MHLLLLGGFFIANILGVLLEGRTLDAIMIRTGYLALVNAVPLGLTGRCNVFLDKCGVPYETRLQLHRWIGRMVLVHSIVHSAIALGNEARTAITLEKAPLAWLFLPNEAAAAFTRPTPNMADGGCTLGYDG